MPKPAWAPPPDGKTKNFHILHDKTIPAYLGTLTPKNEKAVRRYFFKTITNMGVGELEPLYNSLRLQREANFAKWADEMQKLNPKLIIGFNLEDNNFFTNLGDSSPYDAFSLPAVEKSLKISYNALSMDSAITGLAAEIVLVVNALNQTQVDSHKVELKADAHWIHNAFQAIIPMVEMLYRQTKAESGAKAKS